MKRLSKPPFHGRGKIEIIERVGYSPLYIQAHAASCCVPPPGEETKSGQHRKGERLLSLEVALTTTAAARREREWM